MNATRWEWLDQIEAVDAGGLSATASFPPHRYPADDHFPGTPCVPGVLLLEAMAQAAGWWVAAQEAFTGKCLLAGIDEARFRQPALPGQPVQVQVTGLPADGSRRAARCRLTRHPHTIATALIALRFFRFDDPQTPWRPPCNAEWLRTRFHQLRHP
ncbi:MAG: 3-hydroxyacyl-ACP dehydratase FabZ family protein [Verrucomicrobiia bacterium]